MATCLAHQDSEIHTSVNTHTKILHMLTCMSTNWLLKAFQINDDYFQLSTQTHTNQLQVPQINVQSSCDIQCGLLNGLSQHIICHSQSPSNPPRFYLIVCVCVCSCVYPTYHLFIDPQQSVCEAEIYYICRGIVAISHCLRKQDLMVNYIYKQ